MTDMRMAVAALENASSEMLMLRKWSLEREIAAIRRELQSRDARAVDEACNLDIPVNP